MSGMVAGAVLANLASNAMADAKAETQFENEQQLMNKQNAMNQHNALMAYMNQVQGAKLAGLNPAMLNGATPQVAAPVSKGNAQMAENVEFDPASLLMQAQAENLRAQTDKTEAETDKIKGVDTENTRADTDLKYAQKLFTGANQAKVEEETRQIRNINQTFDAENDMLANTGMVMAEKWQKSPWYKSLAPDTKATIDSIADGTLPLSIGGLNAIEKTIATQKNLSDADRTLVKNAFDNTITDAMSKNKDVMKALELVPQTERKKAEAEIKNLVASAREHNANAQFKESEYNAETYNNPEWAWANFIKEPNPKNFGIWMQASYSKKLNRLFETANRAAENVAGGLAIGKGAKIATKNTPDNWMDNVDTKNWNPHATRERPNYNKTYKQMKDEGLLNKGANSGGSGVQNMLKH